MTAFFGFCSVSLAAQPILKGWKTVKLNIATGAR